MPTTTTTTRTAISESSALAPGLRLVRRRRLPAWLVTTAVVAAGLTIGAIVAGLPPAFAIGALSVAITLATTLYRAAIGIALLAFVYPFNLSVKAGLVKWTVAGVLLGMLALVWVLQQLSANPPQRQKTPLDWPVAAFAAATVLSLLSLVGPGADPDQQMVGMIKAAGGFLIFFFALYWLKDRRDLWLILSAVIMTGLLQAVLTVIPVITHSQPVSVESRASGMTVDANLFAGFLVLVTPLVLACGLSLGRRPWLPVLAGLATLVCAIALVASLSRSGWLGLLVGVGLFATLLPERRRQILVIAGAVVCALMIAGLAGPIADRIRAGESNLPTLLGRFPVWWVGVQAFIQHPVFGVGLQNLGDFVRVSDPSLHVNHAHNIFVNMAAERGMLGLLTFGAVVIVLFQTLGKALHRVAGTGDRTLAAGFIASFAAFFVHSLFDVSYYDYRILLLFWLLVAMSACLPRLFGERAASLKPGLAAHIAE